MTKQAPAFFVFDTKITDMDALTPYLENVEATFKAFDGELIVQGGELEVFEGTPPQGIVVILKFADMATAKAWYASDAYQAIVHHRHAGSQANGWLVEGLGL
ncbi:DUF1330 domain-containing protein [Oceanobacter kriegii]|uniref:DUF1330 domain-containing protein n=1 Tax=Oceanobacter kriegii TaxID=64972 RepID=UPI0004891332|nr:DUF1330 domain-containing protein [Oceanobacter kriegii]